MKNAYWCLLILMASYAYGVSDPCTTARVLTIIRPGAAWAMSGDSMKNLKWLDTKQKKPSESEVQKARQACIADTESREARKAQARLEVKDPKVSTDKKVEALILLLDMDR